MSKTQQKKEQKRARRLLGLLQADLHSMLSLPRRGGSYA